MYSFDIYHCHYQLYLFCKSSVKKILFLYNIINNGLHSVSQYHVRSFYIFLIRSSNGERVLNFFGDLGRNLVITFLVTFCLTILKNLMNQTTNYIKDNYKMALTINITSMMVPGFRPHFGLQQSASNCVINYRRPRYIKKGISIILSY